MAMDSTLTSSPLPSLSPLTGSIRPGIATNAIEKALIDSQRRWLSTPGGTRYQTTEPAPSPFNPSPKAGTTGLKELANKHLSAIDKAPGTPYQRVLSPAAKAALKQEMAQKLAAFMQQLQGAAGGAGTGAAADAAAAGDGAAIPGTSGADTTATAAAGAGGLSGSGRLGTPRLGERLATPQQQQRPGTATLQSTELVMSRPSSRLSRLGGAASPSSGLPPAVSSSWNGPLSALEQQRYQQQQQQGQGSGSKAPNFRPSSRLGALSRLSTPLLPPPLRAAILASPGGGGGSGRAEVWTNSTSAPASPRRAAAAVPADAALIRPGTGSGSGAGPSSRPRMGGIGTSTGLLNRGVVPGEKPKPSRGMMFSVFQDLDTHGEGRVTYSTFEDAMLLCGVRTEQSRRLFDAMDQRKQGFLTVHEWGSPDFEARLGDFTRLYIQKTRGTDGRYKGAQEIDNLYAALQLALYKLHIKNSGRSVSHERLIQAFEYVDRDRSGVLDRKEVLDAFNGLGIYINDQVLDEAMHTFDKDSNGTIEYQEFVSTLFPTLSKGYKM